MHDLGATTSPIATEDIAIQAYKRCPEQFALPKHPEFPNIEAVRKRLQSEMTKDGLVMGNSKRGWLLTTHGLELLEAQQSKIAQRQVRTKKHHVSVERVTGHVAYQRYMSGQSPSKPEMLESLGCNINTEAIVVQSKLELYKTRANVLGDENLINYLNECERSLLPP
jgi:hypothetical protein